MNTEQLTSLQATIVELLSRFQLQPVPRTKLVKLVYFVDYIYFQHTGRTLTGVSYVWDHYGPNAAHDEIVSAAEELVESMAILVRRDRSARYGGLTHYYRFNVVKPPTAAAVTDALALHIIDDVARRFRDYTAGEIADASKLTPPFKDARQGAALELDRADSYYKLREDVRALDADDLKELQSPHGTPLTEVLAKYTLAG